MDAEPASMAAAKEVGADRVELYTEPYAAAFGTDLEKHQLKRFEAAARVAAEFGLVVNAGHDLNRSNLTQFLRQVPSVKEVSIGHALISDALELGYTRTVQEYLQCIDMAFS
jgi:pyridoxine 5-phosphate synthase